MTQNLEPNPKDERNVHQLIRDLEDERDLYRKHVWELELERVETRKNCEALGKKLGQLESSYIKSVDRVNPGLPSHTDEHFVKGFKELRAKVFSPLSLYIYTYIMGSPESQN